MTSAVPHAARALDLTDDQLDRAEGVLLGQAVGDVMGVPYETGSVPLNGRPELLGGGFGNYAPGEWSDDTQMALVIADVAATGADLTAPESLDAIARGWCRWFAQDATSVGAQTRHVLGAVAHSKDEPGIAERLRQASAELHERTGRTAGNGALMRTGVVGLTRLHDRRATAAAARAIAALTHADPLAGDSCVIAAELVRAHVAGPAWSGMPYHGANPMAALDLIPEERREFWHDIFDGGIGDATQVNTPPAGDGYTVHALVHAVLAWVYANHQAARERFFSVDRARVARYWMDAVLMRALAASEDKDTVAAITGTIAGSYLGASALDPAWVEAVHGLPVNPESGKPRTAADLRTLARQIALAGVAAGSSPPQIPDAARRLSPPPHQAPCLVWSEFESCSERVFGEDGDLVAFVL